MAGEKDRLDPTALEATYRAFGVNYGLQEQNGFVTEQSKKRLYLFVRKNSSIGSAKEIQGFSAFPAPGGNVYLSCPVTVDNTDADSNRYPTIAEAIAFAKTQNPAPNELILPICQTKKIGPFKVSEHFIVLHVMFDGSNNIKHAKTIDSKSERATFFDREKDIEKALNDFVETENEPKGTVPGWVIGVGLASLAILGAGIALTVIVATGGLALPIFALGFVGAALGLGAGGFISSLFIGIKEKFFPPRDLNASYKGRLYTGKQEFPNDYDCGRHTHLAIGCLLRNGKASDDEIAKSQVLTTENRSAINTLTEGYDAVKLRDNGAFGNIEPPPLSENADPSVSDDFDMNNSTPGFNPQFKELDFSLNDVRQNSSFHKTTPGVNHSTREFFKK